MNRRDTILALFALGTAVGPVASFAQQRGKVWRIGFLAGASRPVALETSVYAGFLRGMHEAGYSEERDFVVEWRFAEGRFELFPGLQANEWVI